MLKALSDALNVSAETLLAQAGLIDAIAATAGTRTRRRPRSGTSRTTEDAIHADPRLSDEQKAALIAVYRTMLGSVTPRETSVTPRET